MAKPSSPSREPQSREQASPESTPYMNDLFTLWDYLVAAVGTAVNAVATTIAYHDLRVFREDLGTEDLASVFD